MYISTKSKNESGCEWKVVLYRYRIQNLKSKHLILENNIIRKLLGNGA